MIQFNLFRSNLIFKFPVLSINLDEPTRMREKHFLINLNWKNSYAVKSASLKRFFLSWNIFLFFLLYRGQGLVGIKFPFFSSLLPFLSLSSEHLNSEKPKFHWAELAKRSERREEFHVQLKFKRQGVKGKPAESGRREEKVCSIAQLNEKNIKQKW